MKTISRIGWGLFAALALACLTPIGAGASVGTSPVKPCTMPSTSANTFTVKLTKQADGTPDANPSTNENGICVTGNNTISFDTTGLAATDTWSATFPMPNTNGVFQNGCKFGNGPGQSSSCQVIASPPSYTYSYTVTINGKTLDPHVIIR